MKDIIELLIREEKIEEEEKKKKLEENNANANGEVPHEKVSKEISKGTPP